MGRCHEQTSIQFIGQLSIQQSRNFFAVFEPRCAVLGYLGSNTKYRVTTRIIPNPIHTNPHDTRPVGVLACGDGWVRIVRFNNFYDSHCFNVSPVNCEAISNLANRDLTM